MKLFLILSLISYRVIAGLPPTTSQGSGDSTDLTTYKFRFPNITVTHSGTLATFNTVNVAGGGTGATSLTANNVILGNGTSAVQFVAPGTSGNVLKSNGTTWISDVPAAGTDQVRTISSTNPVIYSGFVSAAGVVSNQIGNMLSGNCTYGSPVATRYNCPITSGAFSGASYNCVAVTNATNVRYMQFDSASSSSNAIFMQINSNTSGASSDTAFNFVCHGIR
jgi:hypothetical protein